jgi:hypothetical protein
MLGETSEAAPVALSFGDTRSWAAGDAEGDERRGSSQLDRRLTPEDAVPEDARGHIIGATGQAEPGTLGKAKQVAQKDRRGGFARNSIAGKARRRGTGVPGKRHRRTWTREDLGKPDEPSPGARKKVATGKPEAPSLARPMD